MPPCPARSVGWRTAGACLALASLLSSVLAGSHPAAAADWQILYRLSEMLRVSDNIELRPDPEGPAFSSHTGAGLDIRALTPTAEWGVTGDIGKIVYFGEGAPDDRRRMTVQARSDLLKRTRSTDFNLNAHFHMAPATGLILIDPVLLDPVLVDPEFADLGLELVDFDRISYGGRGGFIHRWTRVDDIALSARANRVDFTETATGVTPYTYVELDGLWTRRLTRRVDGRMRVSAAHFRSEDDSARRLIYNAKLGTNIRATRRLTVDANAGVAVIDQRTGELAGASLEQSDRSAGFVGDFSLIFTPRRDTTTTLALSQQVSPDSLGDLRTTQVARGSVDYRINHRSSLNLLGAFTNSTEAAEGGGSRQTWTVSPSYRHALSRSWDLTLSYRWLKSDDAQSNSGFLTLSHRGTILP
jgi:hypothetical protein